MLKPHVARYPLVSCSLQTLSKKREKYRDCGLETRCANQRIAGPRAMGQRAEWVAEHDGPSPSAPHSKGNRPVVETTKRGVLSPATLETTAAILRALV